MNEPNQLVRVLEAAFGPGELTAVRRIAAQCQHVLDPERANAIEHAAGIGPRRVHARQVRHRRQVVFALDAVHDRERLVARAATGAVRDRTEVRTQPAKRRNGLLDERALALVGLGREELEGNDGAPGNPSGGVDVTDVLNHAVSGDYHVKVRSTTGGVDPSKPHYGHYPPAV